MKANKMAGPGTSALLLLIALVMGGCGGRTAPGTAGTAARQGAKLAPKSKDPFTVTYYNTMHPSDRPEHFSSEAPGVVAVREATGASIVWKQLVPGGNAELVDATYSLMITSGDIPDVVLGNAITQLKKFPQAWTPIDTIIKADPARYPNLKRYILDDDYVMAYLGDDDGHVRVIPQLSTRRIGSLIYAREDKLNQWGMADPVTLEDWEKALRRAKQDGMIPWMTRNRRGGIFQLLGGYIDGIKEDYFAEDGVVKYGALDPRFKAAVEIARRWYADGLIDREYLTTDLTKWSEAQVREEVFATYDNPARISLSNKDYDLAGSRAAYKGLLPMRSPRTGLQITTDHWPKIRDKSGAINVNTKVPPERILDMFEWMLSPDGFMTMNFGVEGVSYTWEPSPNPISIPGYDINFGNRLPVTVADFTKKVNEGLIPHPIMTKDMPKIEKDALYFEYVRDTPYDRAVMRIRDIYMEQDVIREHWISSIAFTDAERGALAPYLAELNTYRSEMLDKFIMGVEPLSKWNDFTAKLESMGVGETLKIYQAGLDRLLKK
jgi:putative aldouronate transport system substrate-binding protein